jgi:choice-of-anchor B domain-containing protein
MKSLGNGRANMLSMADYKNKLHMQKTACQADGSCPELNRKMPTGPAPCVDGFAGEYPCRNIDLVAFLDFYDLGYSDDMPQVGSKSGNDIWVWHDVDNSQNYAIVGTTGGSSMVRITDPYNPEVLGFLPSQTLASTWRDMKVVNNFAFIGSEAPNHGIQCFDLTQLRTLTADNTRVFTTTVHYTEVGSTHNIVSNPENNRIYAVGATQSGYNNCRGGLHTVDVSDPMNPTFIGCFSADGYTHDAQCVIYPDTAPDSRYHGREICFNYNEDTFTIVDNTDAANAVMLSRVEYQGSQYTHQGWSTESFKVALLDDELDESRGFDKNTKTYIWDIVDLTNPILKNTFVSTQTAIDHNQYIVGQYTHQTNYEAGYRVLRIDEPGFDLTEVAYFDTFPSSTEAEFQGTWSNYPWLPDGIVVLDSIDYGLFIVKVNYAAIEAEQAAGFKYGESVRYRRALHGGSEAVCPNLVDKKQCTP